MNTYTILLQKTIAIMVEADNEALAKSLAQEREQDKDFEQLWADALHTTEVLTKKE